MQANLSNIFSQFVNVEGVSVSFEPLHSGHINDTFKVQMPEQAFILQRLNTAIFQNPNAIMANVETVAKHLKSNNYPLSILQFLKTKEASFFHKDNEGSVWRVCSFVEDSFSILKVESAQQAFEAAAAYGEFFACLADLEASKIQTIIPDFHNVNFRVRQYRDAMRQCRDAQRADNAREWTRLATLYIPQYSERKVVPPRITHNDTKISNLLFSKKTKKPVCVIDLDTLQVGSALSEFGDMVRSYTPQYGEEENNLALIDMRFDYFEALLEGFMSKTKHILAWEEKRWLVFGAKRTIFVQALRFLTDYINGDIYYKTEYADQNLVRASNQMTLLQSVDKQSERMEQLIQKYL